MEGCDDDETGKVFLALVKFDCLAIMLNLVTSKKTYLAAVTNRRVRAVVPKVCSADHKWSANPYRNQYFVLRGALKYFNWSANQKSLGTTGLGTLQKAKAELGHLIRAFN